jgi:hypothetical protein
MLTFAGRQVVDTDASAEPSISAELHRRLRVALNIGLTFTLVCVGWIFFRAESVVQAVSILSQITIDMVNVSAYESLVAQIADEKFLKQSTLLLIAFVIFEWTQRTSECPLACLKRTPITIRWAAYTVLIWSVLYYQPTSGSQQFIYFAF